MMDVETEKYIASLLAAKEQSLKEANVQVPDLNESRHVQVDNVNDKDPLINPDQTAIDDRTSVESNESASLPGVFNVPRLLSDPPQTKDGGKDTELGNHPYPGVGAGASDVLDEVGDCRDPPKPTFYFDRRPSLKRIARTEFAQATNVKNNFLKGCKWSPDGSCLLTASDDRVLRLFDLYEFVRETANSTGETPDVNEELQATLRMRAPDLIYDYCWYPFMNSDNPATCCFLSSSRESPVHLHDAFNGSLRCSYRAFNHVEEFVAAQALTFNPDGSKIVCGYDKCIRIFDLDTPGRTCESFSTFTKKTRRGVKGIVSCFDFHPSYPDLFACGSYGKSIGLFSLNSGEFQYRLDGQSGGVTGVRFTPCGNRLMASGRKDDEILCYDIRNLGQIMFVLKRTMTTNQRLQFELDTNGRYLFSGDTSGNVHIWDMNKYEELCYDEDGSIPTLFQFKAHDQSVNGVSLHPFLPLLATSSGQRRFMEPVDDDESDDDDDDDEKIAFSDPTSNEHTSHCRDDGNQVPETTEPSTASKTNALTPKTNALTTETKHPVWRRVLPFALDNSLKIWQFPPIR